MAPHFTPVPNRAMLEHLLARSLDVPVLLFLHDPHCGLSLQASQALRAVTGPIPLIDVAVQQRLARAIAERTGVTHASPQVILLRQGAAVWSATHGRITTAAVMQAVEAHR